MVPSGGGQLAEAATRKGRGEYGLKLTGKETAIFQTQDLNEGKT